MPLEEIIRYLIADRGVNPKNKGWKAILKESEKTFHTDAAEPLTYPVRVHFGHGARPSQLRHDGAQST